MPTPKPVPQVTADVVEAKVLVAVGDFTPGLAHGTIQLHAGDGTGVSIYAGTDEPSLVTLPGGSLYLRHLPDGTGELWFKANLWVRVAG